MLTYESPDGRLGQAILHRFPVRLCRPWNMSFKPNGICRIRANILAIDPLRQEGKAVRDSSINKKGEESVTQPLAHP